MNSVGSSLNSLTEAWFAARVAVRVSNSRFKYFAGEQVHEPVLPEVPCGRGHGSRKREGP